MTEGEQDANGDLVPGQAEQAEASSPRLAFNQFNQQTQLNFPSVIEALNGLADNHPALADKIVDDIAAHFAAKCWSVIDPSLVMFPRSVPQGADRDGLDAVGEREAVRSGVQHGSGDGAPTHRVERTS